MQRDHHDRVALQAAGWQAVSVMPRNEEQPEQTSRAHGRILARRQRPWRELRVRKKLSSMIPRGLP